jgi:hypothetical protein
MARKNPDKVVDYGSGPTIFATGVVSTRRDGNIITATLGVEEYRAASKSAPPSEEHVVHRIVGQIVMPDFAFRELIDSLNTLYTAGAAAKAEEGPAGVN